MNKILKKRVSRILFTIFLFNNKINNKYPKDLLWNQCVENYQINRNDVDWELLQRLYEESKEINEIDLKKYGCMDLITESIIIFSIIESKVHKEFKLIISEAMKLADFFDVNAKYINSILDEIFLQKKNSNSVI